MGKLHALRRDIERNPRKWCWRAWWVPGNVWTAYGAKTPAGLSWYVDEHSNSYRAFVAHVLRGLGYKVAR